MNSLKGVANKAIKSKISTLGKFTNAELIQSISLAFSLTQLKKSFWFSCSLYLLGLFSWSSTAITNGIDTEIGAVVQLYINSGICSGTVIGHKPLTVLSAAHCTQFRDDRVVTITNHEKNLRARSTQIILPDTLLENETFKRHQEISLEIEHLKKEIARTVPLSLEQLLSRAHGGYRNIRSPEIDALQEELEEIHDDWLILKGISDASIIMFEEAAWYEEESTDTLLEDKKVMAIDTDLIRAGTKVLLVGYGKTKTERHVYEAHKQKGTVNYLKEHLSLKENAYMIQGTSTPFAKDEISEKYSLGKYGIILKGDSGGPVIGEKGVVAINRAFTSGGDTLHPNKPETDWPKIEPSTGLAFYSMSFFVATGSEVVGELLEKAERAGAHIVRAHDTETTATDILSFVP